MTRRSIAAALVLVLCGACQKDRPAGGCAKDTDCQGSRVCAKGECVEPGGAAAASAPAAPVPAAPVPAAPAADRALCEQAVTAFRKLAQASATTEQLATLPPVAKDVEDCATQGWAPALLECTTRIGSLAAYFSECSKLAFQGTIDLRIGRELPPGTEPTQDGDFTAYRSGEDGTCGLLLKVVPAARALFVVCGDQLLAGPLTTVDEVSAVVRELQNQSRAGHDMREHIMQNWPRGGGGRYRVYDAQGRMVREE